MYDLEISKAVEKIKAENAKTVCIQLPDGLRPKANEIQKEIESSTGAKVIIWLGSCYGACDIPTHLDKFNIDLLIHWGHSEWRF